MHFLLYSFTLYLLFLNYNCNALTIQTRLGAVRGEERKSREGNVYHAFTRIPYAKPPLNDLRFKNPVKSEAWEGVLNATGELPKCIQIPSFIPSMRSQILGQEDCLYLSVYTPQISPVKKLPVLVYVHGGGFRCGDVGTKQSADYFMDENVVMVNFHYRLAALGFLSTENSIIPGNFGLKDQAMVIKWIHENIDSFGGDPNQITVFGESAGGASTHLLGMSPLSKHLIKGIISESGVVNKFWAFSSGSDEGNARAIALKVVEKVGCQQASDQAMLECLQKVDAKQLVSLEMDFLFWDFDPAVVFRPVQEVNSEGAFMPFDPLKTNTNKPWLTGIVSNEGLLKTGSLLTQNISVTEEFIKNIDEYLPKILYLNNTDPLVNQSVELLKERYFSAKPLTVQAAQIGLGDLYSDSFFIYPMGEAIRRHQGPLYQYYFNYRGASSLLDKWGDLNLGVSHADELLMLFNWRESFPKSKPEDEQLSKKLVRMWANFARNQNPTSSGDPEWPEGRATHQYLEISTKFSVGMNLKQEIIDWWSDLPIYKNHLKIEL